DAACVVPRAARRERRPRRGGRRSPRDPCLGEPRWRGELRDGPTTSCFLLSRAPAKGSIWPVAIYPDGSIEVVFQHLATRPPFDDLQLRDELRSRLNRIAGVDIPTSKLTLRPSVQFSSI